MIAAVLNFDGGAFACRNRHRLAGGLLAEKRVVLRPVFARLQFLQSEFGQFPFARVRQNQSARRGALELTIVVRRGAAGHSDNGLRIISLRARGGFTRFFIGLAGHGASVNDIQIGGFAELDAAKTFALQNARKPAGIGLIDFAAQRVNRESGRLHLRDLAARRDLKRGLWKNRNVLRHAS